MKTVQRREAKETTVDSLSESDGRPVVCRSGYGLSADERVAVGIKHKSLILAQDERWRRA